MIGLPIIGSFLEATGMIIEKKILKLKSMNFKNYTVYEFFAIVILMLPIIFIFSQGIKPAALEPKNLVMLAIVVIAAIAANLFTFYSLKRETISEFEPIWIMQPLFTIVLAFILFQSERNWALVVIALIASISIVIAHIKKHHLVLDKYILSALAGSFLFAVELVASKPILNLYTPFSFYFIRCLVIFIVCFALFRPSTKSLNKKNIWLIAIVGLIWVFYRAIMYYGYETLGIIYTTTLFILSPVLMIIFAVVFLKEKPSARQIISTLIVIACVVASILINR